MTRVLWPLVLLLMAGCTQTVTGDPPTAFDVGTADAEVIDVLPDLPPEPPIQDTSPDVLEDVRNPPIEDTTPDVQMEDVPIEDTPIVEPDAPEGVGTPCAVRGVEGVCLEIQDCTGDNVPTPGLCPGPSHVQCCAPRLEGQVCDESAMPQPNLGLTEAPGSPGCPNGMAAVSSYCIDRYEAIVVTLDSEGVERPWSPFFNPGQARIKALSVEGAVPQGYINGNQARAACDEAGKRLCTDEEWLRACQGSQGSTFPYGAQRQDGVCNDARAVHPAVEYFGTTDPVIFSMIDNPCLNQLPEGLALTGDHASCVTQDGVFDMMGNLHEWTANPTGIFRGGFYVDTVRNGPGCLYRTTAHTTGHWDYSTGFRCCADRL